MTSLHIPDLDDRPDPPAPRRPLVRVLPNSAPAARPSGTDYESMSIPQLCRVILDADTGIPRAPR